MTEDLFSSPRWYLRYFQFVARLPVQKWLLVVLVIVINAVAHHMVAWQGGYLDPGQFNLSLANHGLFFVFVPYSWIFIAKRAARDLRKFFSNSGKSEKEIGEIITDFNSIPELLALTMIVFGGLNGLYSYRVIGIPNLPLTEYVLPGVNAFNWMMSAGLGYMMIARMVRQASIMNRFYADFKVDIFKPERIYALSRYGAFTSAVLFLLFYALVFLSFPGFIFTPLGVVSQLLVFIPIVMLFFIPLSGINRRMRQAKNELLSGANENLRDLYDQIDTAAKSREYATVEKLQGPLATLRNSKEMIKAIPTWPWQPNTLRNLFAPLLFPVVVFLIQLFIERVLGQ